MKNEYAARFNNETLAAHWQVTGTRESFDRLLHHLESKTRVRPYFEEAVRRLGLDTKKTDGGAIVADIGAGVCWTSAILAKDHHVKRVYAVDPSNNRLNHARYVIKHFGVEDKVRIVNGTFLEPNVPEPVDLVVMCGSIHHCFDNHLEGLFKSIKRILKPEGSVLIACEHYVNWAWSAKRILSYFKNFNKRSTLYYSPIGKIRAPEPYSGEHWRTRRELYDIFSNNGFAGQFFVHKKDMCKDKPTLYHRAGWRYYNVILRRSDER